MSKHSRSLKTMVEFDDKELQRLAKFCKKAEGLDAKDKRPPGYFNIAPGYLVICDWIDDYWHDLFVDIDFETVEYDAPADYSIPKEVHSDCVEVIKKLRETVEAKQIVFPNEFCPHKKALE